jgi:[acyl-carrier-protein] S-malonyltransferase
LAEHTDGVAVVFPGQGSQRAGMARAWRDHPSFARWADADELLGWDVSRLGLDADADELRIPLNCQIALFVHGVVLYQAWAETATPVATAGHSLGEYNALVAAGILDFADGLRLVEARARATQAAADDRPGTMVACLGFPVEVVAAACERVGAHLANDNAPGQVVVAGPQEALDRLRDDLADSGERGKVVALEVGAAYHSPHMQPAVEPFGAALDRAAFRDGAVPVVANVDARPHRAAGDWPEVLRAQLTSPVRWRETVATLAETGVTQVVELGASAVLTGLVKRTDRSLGRHTVVEPADLSIAAAGQQS